MALRECLLPLTLLFLTGFSQAQPLPDQRFWYKDAIIYSVDVKTFKDSDGDGIGDFRGLTAKLGYIDSLGINTIWLAPFQPSPLEDDGYDITDYYTVDPRVGNMQDFKQFLDSCHQRKLRVIIDLVLDHTSDKHPWFKESAATKNGFRDWYFWEKKRPPFADSGVAFPGVQRETWTYYARAKAWYYHRFYNFQPHLNFYQPAVRKMAADVIRQWLKTGIDGFRVDAVPFMIEKPDPGKDTAYQLLSYIPEMHQITVGANPSAILLGEANVPPARVPDYSGRHGEGLQMMFNFYVNQFLFYGLASGDLGPLRKSLLETKEPVSSFQWVNFLRNHDEVDLGRLDSGQQKLAFQAFGPDKNMRLYARGVRRRLAPMLNNSRQKIELAYALAAALPGAFMIRYGEELGMGDDQSLKERLAVRTPMQWTPQNSGGFSVSGQPIRPVISNDSFGFKTINAASENADSNSLLQWIRKLIRIRTAHPEIANGTWQMVDSSKPGLLIIRYEFLGKILLTAFNVSGSPIVIPVSANEAGGIRLESVFSSAKSSVQAQNGEFNLSIPALGFEWYSVSKKED